MLWDCPTTDGSLGLLPVPSLSSALFALSVFSALSYLLNVIWRWLFHQFVSFSSIHQATTKCNIFWTIITFNSLQSQAFQKLYHSGWYRIGEAVSPKFFDKVKAETEDDSPWYNIDNNPGRKPINAGRRSFKPASSLCFELFRNLVERLKNCGLANGHHNILLARGASWLKSTKGVPQQTDHRWPRTGFVCVQFP